MMEKVQELREDLEEAREDYSLNKLVDDVENRRVQKLKNLVASSKEESTSIDKWFFHIKDGDKLQSKPRAVHESEEFVLVRSEMFSKEKEKESGDGKYHAVWMVTPNLSIFRMDWTPAFEKEDYEWTKERVKKLIKQNDKNRKEEGIDKEVVKSDSVDESGSKQVVVDEFREDVLERTDKVDISNEVLGIKILVDDTDSLKELQNELDISEEEVRERMWKDWMRLTANRRKKIIKSILRSRLKQDLVEEV